MDKSKTTQKKILELELQKESLVIKNLQRKIQRFDKANKIVKNAISQEEIDDLKLELKTLELQQEILKSQIEALDN